MSETLLPYYQRELQFIRQLAQDFAKKYPATARRLQLEPDRSTDPHVERLIEGFAFLTARVHHKLDDEFPELTEALLNVLYPHYLAPIPSMAIVQFEVDPMRAQLPEGFTIPRGSQLHTNPVALRPVDDPIQCKYRTGYPVTLWPIALVGAQFTLAPFAAVPKAPAGTMAALRLQFECRGGMPFAALQLDRLRLYLSGDPEVIAELYESIFNNAIQVAFRPMDAKVPPRAFDNPARCLHQVGFDPADDLLSYPNQSFRGYRLLTEFFSFPQKFLFVDLAGWREVCPRLPGNQVEVVLFLNRRSERLEQGVDQHTFRLGCAPIVNLFSKTAEGIPLTHLRHEYPVIPDVGHRMGLEVYSVDAVTHTDASAGQVTEYQPFYSYRHGSDRDNQKSFWCARRRPSFEESDRGTEVYLSFVNLDFRPEMPGEPVVVVQTTCTNRDLPGQLQQMGERLYLELEAAAPHSAIHCIHSPTRPLRPPLQKSAHWRLLSHLNLNHLSLTSSQADPGEGLQAFQEILRLYDFSDPQVDPRLAAVTRQLIDGITDLRCRPIVERVRGLTASGFCRGIEVALELDEQKYVGTGAFLFACVLERFLGLYVSMNSFTKLKARTKQGEGYFKTWAPRAGEIQLL